MELVVQDIKERRIKAGAHAMREPIHLDLQAVRHTILLFGITSGRISDGHGRCSVQERLG
jgi:hypothetical protein